MAFIGKVPTPVPLTSSDITDGIISVAKLTSTLDLSSNTVTLPSGVGGKVLQVVSTAKTDGFSTTATSDTAVTGLSLSITPSSSSSKIFVISTIITRSANTGGYLGSFSIYRDSTRINGGQVGASGSTANVSSSLSILDEPSTTSAITYQVYAKSEGNSSTVFINLPSVVVLDEKAVITAYEIAG